MAWLYVDGLFMLLHITHHTLIDLLHTMHYQLHTHTHTHTHTPQSIANMDLHFKKRIREAQVDQYNYTLVIGEQETAHVGMCVCV
jgi:threonyl-tRNA synthetase